MCSEALPREVSGQGAGCSHVGGGMGKIINKAVREGWSAHALHGEWCRRRRRRTWGHRGGEVGAHRSFGEMEENKLECM